MQIVDEKDELKYGFDMLDATKLLPEELVPVRRIGKLTLNRNPDNFFAETEQVAFCVGNVVPGIDFTNDPLMQARLFSYLDTQLTRLGGPNFAEIPINRPVAPVHNHQSDGHMRTTINTGKALYHPNTVGGGCPCLASPDAGAYVHYTERVEGHKIRERSESFKDHFSQATLFFRSLSKPEQQHLIEALPVRARQGRAQGDPPARRRALRAHRRGAARRPWPPPSESTAPRGKNGSAPRPSPALSMANTVKNTIKGRVIAALVAPGVAGRELIAVRKALEADGAKVEIIAPALGMVATSDGTSLEATKSLLTVKSVLFDAVLVPGGAESVEALAADPDARDFVDEAYKHFKPIGALGEGVELLRAAGIDEEMLGSPERRNGKAGGRFGVVLGGGSDARGFVEPFREAVAQHRHWGRAEAGRPVPQANRPRARAR